MRFALFGAAAAMLGASCAQAQAPAIGVPVEPAPAGAAPAYAEPYRADDIILTLAPAMQDGAELEYAVRMRPGATLVYDWSVDGARGLEDFYVEFHGHRPTGSEVRVASYQTWMAREGRGALTAPFDGTQAWFFQNRSEAPVTVTLRLAGFYELRSIRETVLEEGSDEMPFGPPVPAAD